MGNFSVEMVMPKRKVKAYRKRKPGQSEAEFLVEAIDDLSANMAKWLAIVALAASTPEDNSEEIKALTQRAKAVADVLEDAAGK